MNEDINNKRRDILKGAAVTALSAAVPSLITTNSYAMAMPEKKVINVGFIALTDAAPLFAASSMKLDEKFGIKINLIKMPSWGVVRDKLADGQLDACHTIMGLVVGMNAGIDKVNNAPVKMLSCLNRNGQAISLSNKFLQTKGDSGKIADLLRKESSKGKPIFAQTYPTGTHAMWLNYWLASIGINPVTDVETVVVPPANMAANLLAGYLSGFCVGEPWHVRVIEEKIGFTGITCQEIWENHPEKILAANADFVKNSPNSAIALTAAVLEAAKWLDAKDENRELMAEVMSSRKYISAAKSTIIDRLIGNYDNGNGKKWKEKNRISYYDDGFASYPHQSDVIWFLTQYKRWGMLNGKVNYEEISKNMIALDIYEQAIAAINGKIPTDKTNKGKLMDGVLWTGINPDTYATSFKINNVTAETAKVNTVNQPKN